ncbi:MAG: hypothetical protein LBJ64_13260 [Deltaproteobacteria bacterium]|jgi:hypothetical protein|nr:hypothetical protein [Deltaproteobacteria bacterium]
MVKEKSTAPSAEKKRRRLSSTANRPGSGSAEPGRQTNGGKNDGSSLIRKPDDHKTVNQELCLKIFELERKMLLACLGHPVTFGLFWSFLSEEFFFGLKRRSAEEEDFREVLVCSTVGLDEPYNWPKSNLPIQAHLGPQIKPMQDDRVKIVSSWLESGQLEGVGRPLVVVKTCLDKFLNPFPEDSPKEDGNLAVSPIRMDVIPYEFYAERHSRHLDGITLLLKVRELFRPFVLTAIAALQNLVRVIMLRWEQGNVVKSPDSELNGAGGLEEESALPALPEDQGASEGFLPMTCPMRKQFAIFDWTIEIFKKIVGLLEESLRVQERLTENNMGLIGDLARRFHQTGNMTLEDLKQEGAIGFLKAVQTYDHTLGCVFSSYAAQNIKISIMEALAKNSGHFSASFETYKKVRRLVGQEENPPESEDVASAEKADKPDKPEKTDKTDKEAEVARKGPVKTSPNPVQWDRFVRLTRNPEPVTDATMEHRLDGVRYAVDPLQLILEAEEKKLFQAKVNDIPPDLRLRIKELCAEDDDGVEFEKVGEAPEGVGGVGGKRRPLNDLVPPETPALRRRRKVEKRRSLIQEARKRLNIGGEKGSAKLKKKPASRLSRLKGG